MRSTRSGSAFSRVGNRLQQFRDRRHARQRLVAEIAGEPCHEQAFVAADIDQQDLRLTVRDLVELGFSPLFVPMARIERVAVVQREPEIADRGGKVPEREIGTGKFRAQVPHLADILIVGILEQRGDLRATHRDVVERLVLRPWLVERPRFQVIEADAADVLHQMQQSAAAQLRLEIEQERLPQVGDGHRHADRVGHLLRRRVLHHGRQQAERSDALVHRIADGHDFRLFAVGRHVASPAGDEEAGPTQSSRSSRGGALRQ